MRAGLIAYVAGLALASLAPRPEVSVGVALAVIALSLFRVGGPGSGCRRKMTMLAGAVLLGIAWHLIWAGLRLDAQLAPELEGVDMRVGGVVRGLPRRFDEVQQFQFEIKQFDPNSKNPLKAAYCSTTMARRKFSPAGLTASKSG